MTYLLGVLAGLGVKRRAVVDVQVGLRVREILMCTLVLTIEASRGSLGLGVCNRS
jgi:hypothetical protein